MKYHINFQFLKYIEKTSAAFILQKYQQLVEGHWGVWNKTMVSTKLNRVFIAILEGILHFFPLYFSHLSFEPVIIYAVISSLNIKYINCQYKHCYILFFFLHTLNKLDPVPPPSSTPVCVTLSASRRHQSLSVGSGGCQML